MNVEIKYGQEIKDFENKAVISIGNGGDCDFILEDAEEDILVKLVYSQKYKNYVLINSLNNENILFNNKVFNKVLVPPHFSISAKNAGTMLVVINNIAAHDVKSMNESDDNRVNKIKNGVKKNIMAGNDKLQDLFNNPTERNRIAIVKEIGYKIEALKNSMASVAVTSFILNAAVVILSIVCAFGMTNYLLGLKVDTSASVLNLTTNYPFLICLSTIVLALSFILKQAIYSLLEFNQVKKYGETNSVQKAIIYISIVFMFIVYVINLFYYKEIPGLKLASVFISLLFVGALATVSIASGYFKFQKKNYDYQLMNCEYREDFEAVLKNYRMLISQYVNNMSENKINNVRGNLVNNQMKMIFEMFIGILTAPFLAYGVSNTLASCFPEAANWVRVSGLRFSPIFLVLATFLIIFAFFSFVRAFTISKQIKASEIIKFDGFHDYHSHGVTILGLDSMRGLNKEKNIVMFIACFIILIEFTMNVSYFITEIGGDLQGMFLSFVTALVPTALLVAETHLLSSTMHKIKNYNELLSMLD